MSDTIKCFAPDEKTVINAPIAKDRTYIFDEVLRLFEDSNGNYYELHYTMNYAIVAVKCVD